MPRDHGGSPNTYYEPYFNGIEDNGDGTWNIDVAVVNYNEDDNERLSGTYSQITVDFDPNDPANIDRLEQELQDIADEAKARYPEGN